MVGRKRYRAGVVRKDVGAGVRCRPSHHGRLAFDSAAQLVRYRAGKGGTGPEQTLSYTEYLQRCVRIFLQAMTLLRGELIICDQFGIRHPV